MGVSISVSMASILRLVFLCRFSSIRSVKYINLLTSVHPKKVSQHFIPDLRNLVYFSHTIVRSGLIYFGSIHIFVFIVRFDPVNLLLPSFSKKQ